MPEEICTDPRPGEKALAVMKLVKEVDIFKRPISPAAKPKTKSQKVLDEDTYLQEMGKIIQRDFFPDLEKLKAQNEYLEAVERNDAQKLQELHLKYSSGIRPPTERYASPATFETPMDVRRQEEEQAAVTPHTLPMDVERGNSPSTREDSDDESKSSSKETSRLSLDEYLSSHTSEDNQSFQEIMKEAELKHRQKFAWLYKEEEDSGERKKEMLALPSIEEQASAPDGRPLMVDTWGYRNKNYIMYVPDGVSLTAEEKVEMASRRQSVVHGNTRLTHNPFDERQNKETIQQLAQSQAHALEGKIGVDGKELTLSDTPKVNGYSFVKTPSPAPGVGDTPLMTWGEIEGTPFRLDGGDTPVRTTPGPSFRIPEPPKREKLALALAEKAGERHRDRKVKALEAARKQLASPSPRPGTLDRLNTMSPAAQRLASSQLRRLGSDRALQASYSPSPLTRRGSNTPTTSNRTPTPRTKATPAAKRTPNPNITDNLLNLPKRPRASDFFGL